MSTCPICSRPTPPPAKNSTHPFCSPRCKLIDLGNWLDGNYRIPGTPVVMEESDEDAGVS